MGLTLYQSGMNIFIPRLKPGKQSTLHWFIDISRSSYIHCCHAHTCAFVYNNSGLINYEKKVGGFIIGRTFSQFRSHTDTQCQRYPFIYLILLAIRSSKFPTTLEPTGLINIPLKSLLFLILTLTAAGKIPGILLSLAFLALSELYVPRRAQWFWFRFLPCWG